MYTLEFDFGRMNFKKCLKFDLHVRKRRHCQNLESRTQNDS